MLAGDRPPAAVPDPVLIWLRVALPALSLLAAAAFALQLAALRGAGRPPVGA